MLLEDSITWNPSSCCVNFSNCGNIILKFKAMTMTERFLKAYYNTSIVLFTMSF